MDKGVRRIEKTRTAIYQALNELLRKKKYNAITIQQIIDKANVGRTTFYQHFADKDELLLCCIEDIFESLSTHLHEQTANHYTKRIIPIPAAEIFAHIKENKRLINGILMSDGGDLLFEKFKTYWGEKIEPELSAHLPRVKQFQVPVEILSNYVISTFIELLRWWMKSNGKYTPEQMEEYYFALIMPSVTAM